MTTALTWTGPAGTLATDELTRSQSGRVVNEVIDGIDADTANPNFEYDAAGRLIRARVSGHVLDYGFATTGGCGPQAAPGRNSNRASVTGNGGTPTTYCYDHADRLVSSSDAAVGSPAYDGHGNTTTLGSQTLIYDGSDRHMETKIGGVTAVRYQRDATGRIISRVEGGSTTRYGFSGFGDSPSFVMDATNSTIERTVGLVGGVIVTKRGGLLGVGDVWSYPNVHGDVMATANSVGVKASATISYDPYGQPLATPADNSAGNFDYGWLGQHQRPTEHAAGIATIEMGARQYVPGIGRFLEVDPVEGGSANDYDYVAGDPLNNVDLDGERCWSGVARTEEIRYKDKNGQWKTKTKTKEHCNSVSRSVARSTRGARIAAADVGRGVARGTACVAGQLFWPPSEGGLWIEAGGAIAKGGTLGFAPLAAGSTVVAAGGTAAGAVVTAAAGGAIVLGAAAVGYGAFRVYQECHH